jgi:hypothetical protein
LSLDFPRSRCSLHEFFEKQGSTYTAAVQIRGNQPSSLRLFPLQYRHKQKEPMKEYHSLSKIEMDLNDVIDRLEDNQKAFANRLAQREFQSFDPYAQSQMDRIRQTIQVLKEARNRLGCIDWL